MHGSLKVVLFGMLTLAIAAGPAAAGEIEAQAAFDQLKSLAGTWSGSMAGEGAEAEAEAEEAMTPVHEFRVSAAGTVVMETMGPGTDHEMINMYHLDGDELQLTHYCAAGNQPTMRLDRENSTADSLAFAFTGGSNLDPAVDQHIHSARITWAEDDRLESVWTGWAGGEQAGVMTFDLERSE